MKRILVGLAFFSILLAPAFSFGYISLLQNDNKVIVSPDAYVGTFFFANYYGLGANGEVNLFIPNLYVGGGLHYNNLSYPSLTASFSDISVDAYGKYYILTPDAAKKLFGVPLALGAAGGLGANIWFASFSGYDLGSYNDLANPVDVLAVGIVGYQIQLFGKPVLAEASLGYIDTRLDYNIDLYYPVTEKSSFHLYWVPLIGLGASYTLAL